MSIDEKIKTPEPTDSNENPLKEVLNDRKPVINIINKIDDIESSIFEGLRTSSASPLKIIITDSSKYTSIFTEPPVKTSTEVHYYPMMTETFVRLVPLTQEGFVFSPVSETKGDGPEENTLGDLCTEEETLAVIRITSVTPINDISGYQMGNRQDYIAILVNPKKLQEELKG